MTWVPCQRCKLLTQIDQLDSKPKMTPLLRVINAARGQIKMLAYAADHGHDFTVLECRTCYGPGWSSNTA
ncbi:MULTISPECIES: hypothetical protein [unclassified Mesorhizobium]|uniref:hypothetical protein n=1 Tax=unclassified Mesorhizobium TaxID=325217 RepID=UPI00112B19DC|nr:MULTISPECIES: hypothetical protein [unclassified Mesorhizobium]TPJ51762.1 hypothetical protein FJ426_18830 [Mesorhizobium sp. B2-6-4]TPN42384.1 hypothetical protein FJ979_02245 [Mesorhizobium sp. B1-1-6]